MKKLISLFAIAIFAMLSTTAVAVNAMEYFTLASGYVQMYESDKETPHEPVEGDLVWTVTEEGDEVVLTITGSAPTLTFNSKATWNVFSKEVIPWYDYQNVVTKIIVAAPITAINQNCAFFRFAKVHTVILPDTEIKLNGYMTFAHLSNLKTFGIEGTAEGSVIIPDGITVISANMFETCKSMENLTIHDGVKNIGSKSFYACTNLSSITIKSKDVIITPTAFDNCIGIETIYLYRGSTADEFFADDEYTKIYLDDEVQSSPESDFEYTVSGTSATITKYVGNDSNVIIPSIIEGYPVTVIGNFAFRSNKNIFSVKIPEGVTEVGRNSFSFCVNLTEVIFADSIVKINSQAFFDCDKLEDVILPGGLEVLDWGAFSSCQSLTAFYIPSKVTSIGSGVLESCSALQKIEVADDNACYCSVDGILFNKNMTLLLQYPAGKSECEYTIPNTIAEIARGAFLWAKSLAKVTIPGSVTKIGADAFAYCNSLTSIDIPASVTYIVSAPCRGSSSLKNINVDEKNEYYCDVEGVLFTKDMKTIIQYPQSKEESYYAVPSGVEKIRTSCFSSCNNLEEILLPNGVTTIEDDAFMSAINLKKINIPDDVTVISFRTFYYCFNLEDIIIPNGVTVIENNAFDTCRTLKIVTIPASVTSIGNGVFGNCTALESVIFEAKNTAIVSNAFNNCTDLETIYLYRGSTADEFFPDDSYTKIYLDDEVQSSPESDFEYVINDDGISVTVTKYIGSGGDVVIPSKIAGYNVTIIGEGAFVRCGNVLSVVIPDGVLSLGIYAFNYCDGMKKVTVPASVTNIESSFVNCRSLAEIDVDENNEKYCDIDGVLFTKDKKKLINYPIGKSEKIYNIPKGTVTIDWYAFEGSINLTEIVISDSVKSVVGYAFSECAGLTSMVIPENLTFISCVAFSGSSNIREFVVDEDNSVYCDVDGVIFSKDMKTLVTYPAGGATVYDIPDGVEIIGERAFERCSNLVTVTIPDSVTDICEGVFNQCHGLKELVIPCGVTYISNLTFFKCANLSKISLPEGITGIGERAFYYCESLKNIELPKSLTSIEERAFWGCSSLESIIIPDGVNEIKEFTFAECTSLRNITIPKSIEGIAERAFQLCSNLESVVFESKGTYIGEFVFNKCKNLETIYLYHDSTADKYFSDAEYTKIYLDEVSEPKIEIGSATALVGSTVSVDITLSDSKGVAGLLMKLDFDRTALTLKKIIYKNSNIEHQDNLNESSCDDHVSILLYDEADKVTNGALVTLVFEVAANAKIGDHVIDLYYVEAVNEEGAEVGVTQNDGKITVIKTIIGDVNSDGCINVKDVVLLAQYLVDCDVDIDALASDCNGDGRISIKDIVLLCQYLALWDVTLG